MRPDITSLREDWLKLAVYLAKKRNQAVKDRDELGHLIVNIDQEIDELHKKLGNFVNLGAKDYDYDEVPNIQPRCCSLYKDH